MRIIDDTTRRKARIRPFENLLHEYSEIYGELPVEIGAKMGSFFGQGWPNLEWTGLQGDNLQETWLGFPAECPSLSAKRQWLKNLGEIGLDLIEPLHNFGFLPHRSNATVKLARHPSSAGEASVRLALQSVLQSWRCGIAVDMVPTLLPCCTNPAGCVWWRVTPPRMGVNFIKFRTSHARPHAHARRGATFATFGARR